MILENMSLPSAGATASNSEKDASSVTVATNDVKEESKVSKAVSSSPPGQNVNAINSNTFIMNLEPSGGTGNTSSNTPNKTNLLRLFNENGNRVKTLGIGRIVINRTLLKSNTRTKPKVIRLNTTRVPVSKAPIQLHVKDKINLLDDGKKDDDISGNLANFMNFKFSGLVPTPMKTESPSKNIFKVNLKPPEITLPQVKTSNELSSHSDGSRPVSPDPKDERSDDELTSLSWLTGNDKNLLKTIRSCNPDDVGISLSGDESEEEDELDTASNSNAVFTAKSRVDSSSQGGFATRQYGQPYSPNGKPPYSFSCLIFMAVEDSKHKMLPVKEIYAWVCKHFPYFQTAPSGWKNSIRHNLSLNKCFKKVDQPRHSHDPGKGSLWCIDPAYRPNLIQALKRTPFYPYLYPGGIGQPLSLNNLVSLLPTARSGKIPLWSPSMTPLQPSSCYDPDVESAALNLIGLKGNDVIDKPNIRSTIKELAAEIFSRNEEIAGTIPLVISDPADDHTYSGFNFSKPKSDGRCQSPESDKSAPDAAYEFETCGTDLESDAERLSIAGSDSECDLADSGFVGLKGKRGNVKGKRKGGVTTPSGRKKSRANTKSSSKSTQTPPKKALKVRFRSKKTRSKPIGGKSPLLKNRKRKATPPEGDDALTSDVDSGKDSPKVTTKTRRRTPSKKVQPPPKKKQKRNIEPVHKSPYGTRSSTMTRQTRRRGISEGSVLLRAAARKRRQDSVSYDSEDDEEIKLAAGSLLHLAGIRSQA